MGAHHSFKQPSTKRRQDQIEVYIKILILMFPRKLLYFHHDMMYFIFCLFLRSNASTKYQS